MNVDPESIVATITKLEADRSATLIEIDRVRSIYEESALNAREGDKVALEARELSLKSLECLMAAQAESDEALSAAKRRHAQVLLTYSNIENAKCWEQVESIGLRKTELSKNLEELALKMVDNLNEITRLSAEQYEIAPTKQNTLTGSVLSQDAITNAFRQHLRKTGATWASRYPWTNEIPNFSERIAEGTAFLLKGKTGAEKGAT